MALTIMVRYTNRYCNVCKVLRQAQTIKRGLRAKKLAGEKPTAARGSEEGGAKCRGL